MIEAVVFDLDGTLLNLPINWETLFEEFRNIMRVDNVRPLIDTISKLDNQTKKRVFNTWDRTELNCIEHIIINEKGLQVYRNYANKPKALVTLQGKKIVGRILKKFDLNFKAVVTREKSLFRVEQLTMAIKQLEVPIQCVLFVGNADSDEAASEKVGCRFLRI